MNELSINELTISCLNSLLNKIDNNVSEIIVGEHNYEIIYNWGTNVWTSSSKYVSTKIFGANLLRNRSLIHSELQLELESGERILCNIENSHYLPCDLPNCISCGDASPKGSKFPLGCYYNCEDCEKISYFDRYMVYINCLINNVYVEPNWVREFGFLAK